MSVIPPPLPRELEAIAKARKILAEDGVIYDSAKVIYLAGGPPEHTRMSIGGLVGLLLQSPDLRLPKIVTPDLAHEASYYVLRQWPAYDETGRTVRPLGRLFDEGESRRLDPGPAIAAIDRFLAGDLDDPWQARVPPKTWLQRLPSLARRTIRELAG